MHYELCTVKDYALCTMNIITKHLSQFISLLSIKICNFASMKRAIVIGASSGIGREVARLLICDGWSVGLGARRTDKLEQLREESVSKASDAQKIEIGAIDVNSGNATEGLQILIEKTGGMDLYFHSSGVGWMNPELDEQKELKTVETNALGFTRMIDAVFQYMSKNRGGHIVIISSVAGTKGLGPAPAYSATKAFQNKYIESLEQLAATRRLNIRFTDIRPGFVATDLLNGGNNYPLLLKTDSVARKIISAINHRRHICIIDWRWAILTALWRGIPSFIWRKIKLTK